MLFQSDNDSVNLYSSARPPSSEGARGRLPGVTAWYEGRGTPDLFVLGTAAHSRDYRSSAGGFIHGFRYTGNQSNCWYYNVDKSKSDFCIVSNCL